MIRALMALLFLLVSSSALAGPCDDEEEAMESLADASEAVRAADGPAPLGAGRPTKSLVMARRSLEGLSSCEGQLGRRALYWRALAEALTGDLDAANLSLEALWRKRPPKAEREQVSELRMRVSEAIEVRVAATKRKRGRTVGLGVGAGLAAGGGAGLLVATVVRAGEARTWDSLAAGTADAKDAPLYEEQAALTRQESVGFGIGAGVLIGTAGALGIATLVSAASPAKVAVGVAPTPRGAAVALRVRW